MIVTVRTDNEKINFEMHDVFNQKAIGREARKIIKKRWPEVLKQDYRLEWRY